MRKLPILAGAAIGVLVGLIATVSDDLSLKIVMMAIGVLAGMAVGLGICRVAVRDTNNTFPRDSIHGMSLLPEDRITNYWRDKGKIYPAPGHPDPEGAVCDIEKLL